jgi:cell division septal protein FtsQ
MPPRRTLAMVAALALAAGLGGWLLLAGGGQNVQRVTIVGLSHDASPALEDALVTAARAQPTSGFSAAKVRAAVARYTLITAIRAEPREPDAVTLVVHEREPFLRLSAEGRRVALASDGTVITGYGRLPHVASVSGTRAPQGSRTEDPFALTALRLLRVAPAPIRRRVVALTLSRGVLTIYLHRGPRLIFGDATLPHAKWDAAIAVMATRSAEGAAYIDVRLPSRPAAQVADAATTPSGAVGLGSPTDAATVVTVP